MDHQKLRGSRYNLQAGGAYYPSVKQPVFQIENENGEIAFKTPEIMELVKWFINK